MDRNDLVGMTIGRLHVDECVGHRKGKGGKTHLWYKCTCECGKVCYFRRDHLKEGRVKSCGDCHRIEKEGNDYRYVCHSGESFLFSAEDMELISSYRWHILHPSGNGYAARRDENHKYRLLSHDILGVVDDHYVDHINGDTLDYRRSNLRLADSEKNTWNRRVGKNNSSGYKGVSFSKSTGKYEANISFNKKHRRLGFFSNPEEAAEAYDKAARELYGEFACVNFPREGEQGCRREQPQAV